MALSYPALLMVADHGYVVEDQRWLALVRQVAEAARGKPVLIQVRAKGLAPTRFECLARQAREAVAADVPLLLNGDSRMAAALGYDGVHWPEANIPQVPEAKSRPRWRFAAVHSTRAVRRAELAGADALVFAPVYTPGSKPGVGAGLEALWQVVEATPLPVFALGGITPKRTGDCLRAGARGIAVVSGVLGAASPAQAVDAYLAAMQEVVHGPRA